MLGAALLSRGALAEVVEIVKPDDFYRTTHEMVFEAILQLFASGETIDPITLVDQLTRNGKLDAVGGASGIHDLVATVPTAANAVYYARIVKEKAILRRLIDAGTQVVSMGYSGTDDVNVAVDRAEQMIYDVAQGRVGSEYSPLKELLSEGFERIEQRFENRSEVTGLATGFNDLDRLTAGLQKQNLIILAARPAMGKCVTESSCVVDAKSGSVRRIGDLVARGPDDGPVHTFSLGASGRLHPTEPSDFIDNGERETFTLRTRLGREIRATANHPFLTPSGWSELREIEEGDLVAVPRSIDVFGSEDIPDAEAALLGYMLGDGGMTGTVPILTSGDDAIADEAARWAKTLGCYTTVQLRGHSDAKAYSFVASPLDTSTFHDPDLASEAVPNQVTEMLRRHRVWGCNSHTKFVPDAIFTAPRDQVVLFLSRLFACDGSAWISGRYYGISYSSVSKRLIQDVQHLLLRFGIIAYVRERQVKYEDTRRTAYELEIRDAANIRRFIEEIGIFSKEEQCQALLEAVDGRNPHSNVDLLPMEVWDTILDEKGDRSWADVSEAAGRPRNHNWHVGTRRPSRRIVGELAEAMGSEKLRQIAESDICWDEVVSIERYGVERVYDLEIPVLHNFVADDIIVHNSSLALGIGQYVSVNLERPAIIFSLEMSKGEIVDRVLSSEARIDSSKIRTGRLDDADWASLSDAMGRLAEAPLYIDDTASITLMEIRSKCRRLKQREGLDLVVIDYLQLMESHKRTENRQTEVSEISRGCKMLAKELDVPVLALSQLSRQPENRNDKRPQLADLRESGSLEQDADLVSFIYRDEVYDPDSPDRGVAELIVAKHRNGPTGVVKLAFLDHLTKFANLARAGV
ncbi:MAG: replicative DNA helicase [Actinobacteria bacterium]|nr:replicative DNA helicase [Actinomycetota bacterium]